MTTLEGFAKDKATKSLAKNPDIKTVMEHRCLEFRVKTVFAPLVSVDCERSFSLYKAIFSDRRRNLKVDSIEMYEIVQYNAFMFEWLAEGLKLSIETK